MPMRETAAILERELETYGEGRRCAKCPTVLSIYNDDDYCRPCLWKVNAERRANLLNTIGADGAPLSEAMHHKKKRSRLKALKVKRFGPARDYSASFRVYTKLRAEGYSLRQIALTLEFHLYQTRRGLTNWNHSMSAFAKRRFGFFQIHRKDAKARRTAGDGHE